MGKIIVLDPGHGLNEEGKFSRPLMDCTGDKAICVPNGMYPHENDYTENFYREDIGTLALANEMASQLESMGHTVFLTRTNENNAGVYLSSFSKNEWKKKYWKPWKWIKEFTKNKEADIFVGLHTNAGGGTGTSCFWATAPNGVELSKALTGELNEQLGLKVRRIAKHRYLILRNVCSGRAVLLECLFHDNINDIKLLLTQQGQRSVAKAITDGIHKYSLTF